MGKLFWGLAEKTSVQHADKDYIMINQVNVLYIVNTKIFRRGVSSLYV